MDVKQTLMLVAIVFLTNSSTLAQASGKNDVLKDVQDRFFSSLEKKDYQLLESFYGQSFRGVLSTGRVLDKAMMVEHQRTTDAKINKKFDQLETKVYGDLAVCTGVEINQAKTGTVIGTFQFTRIFMKEKEGWVIVNSQFTTIIN